MTRLVTQADAQRGSSKGDWGLLREFAASGISVGCANTVLNPVGECREAEGAAVSPSKVWAPSPAAAAIRMCGCIYAEKTVNTSLNVYNFDPGSVYGLTVQLCQPAGVVLAVALIIPTRTRKAG